MSAPLLVRDDFIDAQTAAQALDMIDNFRREFPLPVVSRQSGPRPLVYSVVDGFQIQDHLPQIQALHENVTRHVKDLFGDSLEPLADEQVACNINITQPGGSYRYHYDRKRHHSDSLLERNEWRRDRVLPELSPARAASLAVWNRSRV